jgi:D-alanyl-D-alanine carboxypeptidase/D-alanyl-D-alanine-endopeptidase (penicillin-binding protein 4)
MLAAPLAAVVLAGCAVPTSMAAQPQVVPTSWVGASVAPLPEPALLTARLAQVSRAKIDKVAVMVTTTDGTVLANSSGTRPLTPASTMKVVTTMAAVDILGADHRFTTKAVDAGVGKVILVGGGDPVLTDKTSTSYYKTASLQRLAKDSAAALKAKGQTQIALGYDASLFTGPTFSPYWKKKWKSSEARVAALEINSGKVGWRAQTNPPLTAAKAFAARLKKAGITVTKIAAAKASPEASELASVTSARLSTIIKRTLLISDNVGAETLSRHASLANGGKGDFAGAAANVQAWMNAKGLWAPGLKILDGSGLAPGSKLSTETLAKAMRTAMAKSALVELPLAEQTFQPIIGGLPVAWKSGTLSRRFNDASEKAGRNNVHAKTGTLRGVAGLVGYLTTNEGALLVFAELANTSKPVSYTRLYNWLDRTAAATITCLCR